MKTKAYKNDIGKYYNMEELENCYICAQGKKLVFSHVELRKSKGFEQTFQNIKSDKGIYYRQIRSIQTEGFFGDMKENDRFRKYNHRSSEKVYKESLIYIFGKNIGRCHKFMNDELEEYVMKKEQSAA